MKIENLLKIIEVLGTDIFTGYNINQVSKLSKVDIATTFRTLKEMERRNEVLKERKGNNVFYRLNFKNTATLKYCELASIERGKAFFLKNPRLFGLISKIKKTADVIVLFGSLARGEKKPRDIDLLLLSEKKPNTGETEKMIDLKISPIYMEFKEFKEKIKTKNKIVLEIIKDGIIISGENKYWELIKDIVIA